MIDVFSGVQLHEGNLSVCVLYLSRMTLICDSLDPGLWELPSRV